MIYIWLGILILAVIMEIATTQLVSIWFAIGALAAFFAALAGVNQIWIQILVFAVVSVIAVAITRPLVKKLTAKKAEPTNADMVIGKTAVVTEQIDNVAATGAVKVGGMAWTARSTDGSIIEIGETVTVNEISGVKLLVTKN